MWLVGDDIMRDDSTPPPLIYEGLDPVPERKSVIAEITEVLGQTIDRIGSVINAGRKPGMPLSVLRSVAREAPLSSLLIAFLLGVAVSRRR
jgi:hypothetical protein